MLGNFHQFAPFDLMLLFIMKYTFWIYASISRLIGHRVKQLRLLSFVLSFNQSIKSEATKSTSIVFLVIDPFHNKKCFVKNVLVLSLNYCKIYRLQHFSYILLCVRFCLIVNELWKLGTKDSWSVQSMSLRYCNKDDKSIPITYEPTDWPTGKIVN